MPSSGIIPFKAAIVPIAKKYLPSLISIKETTDTGVKKANNTNQGQYNS